MSRDYKPRSASSSKSGSKSKGSPFFSGLLVGLVLGVGLSVAVAIMVKGSDSPFVSRAPEKAPEETAKADTSALPKAEKNADTPEKPRFDFYTILPGSETQVTEQEIKQKQAAPETTKVQESYFLQVGAFQTEQEADNMKAKLALLGLEAIVQTATIPNKGVWHRVRVGPFANVDQINKSREELVQNGFKVDLIKVNSSTPG